MKEGTLAEVLKYLMDRDKVTAAEVCEKTGISLSSVYAMTKKKTNQADLETLLKLANFFGEDISIFCGIEDYRPVVRLSENEQKTLDLLRRLNDRGKRRLEEYLQELVQIRGYQKEDKSRTGG